MNNTNWQQRQRLMVRDADAWYRPGGCQGPVIQFSRVEVRRPGIHEDMEDGWGPAFSSTDVISVWVDPLGRRFGRLAEAIRQVKLDRLNAVALAPGELMQLQKPTPAKGSLLKRDITRVLTPGTVLEEGMLAARRLSRAEDARIQQLISPARVI